MRNVRRRIRGIVGLACIWSFAWACVGGVVGIVQAFTLAHAQPGLSPPSQAPGLALVGAIFFGTYGFLIGGVFGLLVSIAERRSTLDTLSTWRIAVWGGMAGALIILVNLVLVRLVEGIVLGDGVVASVVFAMLGATCAAVTLKSARAGSTAGPGVDGN